MSMYPPSTACTLDTTVLEGLSAMQVEGAPDIVGEMVVMFLDETRQRLDDADAGVRSGDIALVGRAAHSLRGICGTIGANRMGELGGALEDALNGGGDVRAVVDALFEEFGRVREQVGSYSARQAGARSTAATVDQRTR